MDSSELTLGLGGLDLPYSIEAEKSVLGAILLEEGCLERVLESIPSGEYFYITSNKHIYSAMIDMFIQGKSIDFVTLSDYMKSNDSDFAENDGKAYLFDIINDVPHISNVEEYANIVKEKYELRQLISVTREIYNDALKANCDAQMLMDIAEQKIFDIRRGKNIDGLVHIKEALIETYDRLDELNSSDSDDYSGVPTGIGMLDDTIMGLNRSDLILLAARPGMGKTSFALNIAANVAIQSKKKVAFFSLEMTKEQLASRLLSSISGVGSMKLRTGRLSSDEWIKVIEAGDIISKSNLYLDDTSSITIPQMKAKLRRLRNVDLVVIDYLQLMTSSRRIDNRVQEISSLTRNLKIMAKELDVPVITLSQLSRASEQRANHRPLLSDLRDSGSIEQDADIVLFLYREDYYAENEGNKSEMETINEDRNAGECIVAKNRHGEIRTVPLHWQGEIMRFTAQEVFRNE